MKFKYFKYEEFDSPDVQGSGQMMDDTFIQMLDEVREEYGKPISITSGYRTQVYNDRLQNSVKNSAHTKGLAADLYVPNTKERYELLGILIKRGFKRIGIAYTFIHVDIDETKPQNRIWLYG